MTIQGILSGVEVSFTNEDLSGGVLILNHGLKQKYVSVIVYDNNDKKIDPDFIRAIDENTLEIHFHSWINITGTFTTIVSK